jgi:hypothetical protein
VLGVVGLDSLWEPGLSVGDEAILQLGLLFTGDRQLLFKHLDLGINFVDLSLDARVAEDGRAGQKTVADVAHSGLEGHGNSFRRGSLYSMKNTRKKRSRVWAAPL